MAENPPPTLPPPSEPFPGSRTPGWNDPPTLDYNPLTPPATTGRTRLNLSKRVAFPLHGLGGEISAKPTAIVQPNLGGMQVQPQHMPLPSSSMQATSSSQPVAVVYPMFHLNDPPQLQVQPMQLQVQPMQLQVQPMQLPVQPPQLPVQPPQLPVQPPQLPVQPPHLQPPQLQVQPTLVPTASSPAEGSLIGAVQPDETQEYVFRCLRERIPQIPETLNVRREDIERRLEFLQQLWLVGNLNTEVQQKILRLAKAVTEKSFKEAIDTYTSLVMNTSVDCSSWAIALRHIVLTLQPGNSGTEANAAASTSAALVPAELEVTTRAGNEEAPATASYGLEGTSMN